MPPEFEMPAQALMTLEAHETRISRLEDGDRDTSTKLTEHTLGLQHLSEKVEEKIGEVKSDIAEIRSDFKQGMRDVQAAISSSVGTLTEHVTKATESIADTSTRLKAIEQDREKAHQRSQAFKKWAIGIVAGAGATTATYLVQQLLSKLAHH